MLTLISQVSLVASIILVLESIETVAPGLRISLPRSIGIVAIIVSRVVKLAVVWTRFNEYYLYKRAIVRHTSKSAVSLNEEFACRRHDECIGLIIVELGRKEDCCLQMSEQNVVKENHKRE